MLEHLSVLDDLKLNFSDDNVIVMNLSLALITFGVALDIDFRSFKTILSKPKPTIVGVCTQFFILPLVTLILIFLLKPSQGVAFGMILISVCPAGNCSNFMASIAKGNTTLSFCITTIVTIVGIFMIPLSFSFWGAIYNASSPFLKPITIDFLQMFKLAFIIMGIPLIAGMLVAWKLPQIKNKILKPVKKISFLLFVGFIVFAIGSNMNLFVSYIHLAILLAIAHTIVFMSTGFLLSTLFKLPRHDRRAVTMVSGLQNAGLCLALICNPNIFPPELKLGGMSFVAALWGVWHIVSGLLISTIWSKKNIPTIEVAY